VGVDISVPMLESALSAHGRLGRTFVQGDATSLPLRSGAFDSVLMLGGIHHVNDRGRLFSEVARILKPGGKFYFREPVDDFLPWWAPALDHETEHPLRRVQTEQTLTAAGLHCTHWTTHGFLGFCLFMNSDVLVFNRFLRFVHGIREITRWAARVDDWMLKLPGLAGAGLQVVGVAEKTENPCQGIQRGMRGAGAWSV
jgi:SAM-dependent methyltransferase